MNLLDLSKQIHVTKNGTNAFYEARYLDQPCYAIKHVPTGHIELIDYDLSILKSIINRVNRSKALACDKKKKGYILKFYSTDRERSISLRSFVYARYKGLSLESVRKKNICIDDDSTVKDSILDLRSCNLYDAGEIRPHTASRHIDIIKRPETDTEYIAITFSNRANGRIEYTEYSPELYEMLARPVCCNVQYNHHRDRAVVRVHYANNKKGYVIDNLSKFILIYNLHFGQYKNMRGGVKRFINDYYKLSRKYKDHDAAHINSCKWNNCIGNLMFMEKTKESKPNLEMSDFIKWFLSPYNVSTAINDKNEILVEYLYTYRFKCKTPRDYADWQKVFLGKELTGKLQVITFASEDEEYQALTPSGMIEAGIANKDSVRNNEPNLFAWLNNRDRLLSMDDDSFTTWDAGMYRTIKNIPIPDDMKVGESVCVQGLTPFGVGCATITQIKDGGGRA